uniref:Uncharacterized protein n=1 Tax=Phlebotomus papatasi TaxID=29031 RepID=A0A1B0DEN8_PHLPP
MKRKRLGFCENLVREMEFRDPDWYFAFTRMNYDQFEWIFNKLSPFLMKQYVIREPLSPKLRLFITIRYLATGDNYFTLASSFRVGVSTICGIIPEVCELIWKVLSPFASRPLISDTWLEVSEKFGTYWNFPHVCGAIDGKQCRIIAPPRSGSLFYCYKGYFSVVLFGISDAHYRFLYVNIGAYGSSSDAGVLAYSELGRKLSSGRMNIPEASPILEGERDVPYFLIGDEAFGLKNYCMIPYPGRYLDTDRQNFNFRLSRARRVVENTFGILTARWRIYHR